MTDSSWQQAVLRDIGVSGRGFQSLDGAPTSVAQGSWGAEAPPRPAPEPPPPAAPAQLPSPEAASASPEAPPFAPPAEFAQSSSGAPQPQPLLPQSPEPPPPAVQPDAAQPAAQQAAPQQPAPQQPAPQQPAPQQPAPQPAAPQRGADAPAEPQQAEPFVHSEFDWAAAVNPVLGAVPSGDAVQPEQGPADASSGMPVPPAPAHPAAPEQAGPGQPVPADDLVRKNQHGDPLARRMGRGVRNAMGGGAREARERAAFADLMQRSVPSARQIAVASVRGGAGKTTMAALLATELARNRPDRVLAADADAELGSLPLRLGVRPQLSLFDLAAHNPNTFQEAEHFLTRTPDGLYVLSSTRGGRIAGEFTLEMFQTALSSVSRYVAATVVDCGAGILTEVNRGVVSSSHGLVLVTPGTVDGALSARGALEWYANNDQGGPLSRTVIAMVSHAPQVGADLQRAHQMLAAWGLPVIFVPYDRHLATGSSVDLSKVSAAARTAITRIVHEVFSRSLAAGGVR
ncbi:MULTISPECIES: MinD/ParA family protein [unclassified Spirillospora]|uniref:MinD/ParA family ATP-binding protein n=1 Tax=unclassified Spirillospora TaxID=2642701 RepID=UPI00371B337E